MTLPLAIALALAGAPDDEPLEAGDDTAQDEASADPSENAVTSVHRVALLVGANEGGEQRATLRFADSDAKAIASVLADLGGVNRGDLVRVLEPSPEDLAAAFKRIGRLAKKASDEGIRVQLVFYYSGHSDERGLLLDGDLVSYKELRTLIDKVPADVHIAILDSCASGAFTRLKGGTKRAPFLVGTAADVKGHAFLTSSSADEAAQESDRVGGSFFTHYFATGLRGAADANNDKLITLSEAYQFAFDETLARTEITRGGAQHAAYEIQLTGSGDLVMTDLRRTTARLEISPDIVGRVFVRSPRGGLAAELYKPAGSAPVLLALEPGRYQVTVDEGEALWRGEVTVSDANRATLTHANLFAVPRESATPRGGPIRDTPTAPPTAGKYKDVPFNIGLFPPVSLNGRAKSKKVRNKFSVAVGWSRAAVVEGAAFAGGLTIVEEELHGISWSFLGNIARGDVRGAQASNGFNSANSMRGAQFGMVNHARGLEGVSFGLVNVGGRVHGAQVGLVNYAKSADAQIGAVSVTREGGVRAETWTSDTAAFNIGIRLPARFTYAMLAVGMHPGGRGAGWELGGGLGGHIQLPRKFFLDMDLTGYAAFAGLNFRGRVAPMAKFRLLFGWQARPHLAVWGGPVLGVLYDTDADGSRPGYGYTVAEKTTTDGMDVDKIRFWPGFALGLRF